MSTIVTRAGKGSPLTNTEVDTNFTNLNTDKLEKDGSNLASKVSFDTAAALIPATGQITWDADTGTVDIGLAGATAPVMSVGEDQFYRVINQTGSTIAKGTLVMAAGTVGNSGKIKVAAWNGAQPSKTIMGLMMAAIPTEVDPTESGLGYVMAFGKITGIQTNGANYGETWANGDIIYAGASSGLTKTLPAAPNTKTTIAIVINAHASNGTLFVRPSYGSSLGEDELVQLASLANGDVLSYDSTDGRFENKTLAAAGIYATSNPAGYTTNTGTVTSVGGTGTVNGITLTGTVTSSGNLTLGGTLGGIDLTSQISGTLPVANGGTGATTLTANNVLLGNGTSAVQVVAPGTSGNVLTSNGTTWVSGVASSLPSQTGNANKFLFTDGTSASWQEAKYATQATNVVASVTSGTAVTVTYTQGSFSTENRVYYSTTSPVTTASSYVVGNTTSANVTGLAQDTTYYFVVGSVAATGITLSEQVSATTPPAGATTYNTPGQVLSVSSGTGVFIVGSNINSVRIEAGGGGGGGGGGWNNNGASGAAGGSATGVYNLSAGRILAYYAGGGGSGGCYYYGGGFGGGASAVVIYGSNAPIVVAGGGGGGGSGWNGTAGAGGSGGMATNQTGLYIGNGSNGTNSDATAGGGGTSTVGVNSFNAFTNGQNTLGGRGGQISTAQAGGGGSSGYGAGGSASASWFSSGGGGGGGFKGGAGGWAGSAGAGGGGGSSYLSSAVTAYSGANYAGSGGSGGPGGGDPGSCGNSGTDGQLRITFLA